MRVLLAIAFCVGLAFGQLTTLDSHDLAILSEVTGYSSSDLDTWSFETVTESDTTLGSLLSPGTYVNQAYVTNVVAWLGDAYGFSTADLAATTQSDGNKTYGVDNEFFYFNGGEGRDDIIAYPDAKDDGVIYCKGMNSAGTMNDAVVHRYKFTQASSGGFAKFQTQYFADRTKTTETTGIRVHACGVTLSGPYATIPYDSANWVGFNTASVADRTLYSYQHTSGFQFQGAITETFYDDTMWDINSNQNRLLFNLPSTVVSAALSAGISSISVCFNVTASDGMMLSSHMSNSEVVGYTVASSDNAYDAYFVPDMEATVMKSSNTTYTDVTFTVGDDGLYHAAFSLTSDTTSLSYGGSIGIFKAPIVTSTSSGSGSSSSASAFSVSIFVGLLATLIALFFN